MKVAALQIRRTPRGDDLRHDHRIDDVDHTVGGLDVAVLNVDHVLGRADPRSRDEVMNDLEEGAADKTLEFFGRLSLENNGGFASVRTKSTASASCSATRNPGPSSWRWIG
jgi:hypothetical protein